MMSHLHQMLYLGSSCAVVVEKSNAGQTGVDTDNLTLHFRCMSTRPYVAICVLLIRQCRVYWPMMMTDDN